MANKDPSKTEKPTQKKIQDARRDGNVLMSQDINSLSVVLAGLIIVSYMFNTVVADFEFLYMSVLEGFTTSDWTNEQFIGAANYGYGLLAKLILPQILGVMIVAIIAIRSQVGHYYNLGPLKWKFDKLNPVSGLKSLKPDLDKVVKICLTLAKVFVIAFFVTLTIRDEFNTIVNFTAMPLFVAIQKMFYIIIVLTIKILIFFIIVAILDYLWKHHKYHENLMMSKQEVKDEHKNAEGNPEVKKEIRKKMQQASMMRMMVEIPNADVVVTNPTHVAVALKYSPGSYAPTVVAKGLRKRALRIREIAKNNNVPIVEAPPLARSLYRNCKIGSYIPEDLFTAVATILAKIHAKREKKLTEKMT